MSSGTGDKACRGSAHSGSGVARRTKPQINNKELCLKEIYSPYDKANKN